MNRITLQRLALALADHSTARLPVELQQGPEGTLLVAGTSRWCRYLPERFFGGPAPHRRLLGHVPVWCLPKVVERWLPRVDLAIARVTVLAMGHFPAGRQLHVPEWVCTVAPVPSSARFPAATWRGRKQQLILKQGLSWRCSHDPSELGTFIARDYRPYILQRYGQEAYLRSERWLNNEARPCTPWPRRVAMAIPHTSTQVRLALPTWPASIWPASLAAPKLICVTADPLQPMDCSPRNSPGVV